MPYIYNPNKIITYLTVQQRIHNKLAIALRPLFLEITDDSHHHKGHAMNTMSEESHFTVLITPKDSKISSIELHRQIFEILKDEMRQIHALCIKRANISKLK